MPPTSMPFFSVPAVRVRVNSANVHVFEFGSVPEADAAASRVSADGSSIGATQILWVSGRHDVVGVKRQHGVERAGAYR